MYFDPLVNVLMMDVTIADRVVACFVYVIGAMLMAWGVRRWTGAKGMSSGDDWDREFFLTVLLSIVWPFSLVPMLVMLGITKAIDWLDRDKTF